jgi:uncharacterized protein (TIGR04255 family)
MQFNQCEVSYINLIMLPDGKDANAHLPEILTIVSDQYSDAFLPRLERGAFNLSYVLPSESGKEPFGRLHVAAHPVTHRAQNRPALRLQLTARGNPNENTLESALSWLDAGREAAVKGFASITTKEMHHEWERTDK